MRNLARSYDEAGGFGGRSEWLRLRESAAAVGVALNRAVAVREIDSPKCRSEVTAGAQLDLGRFAGAELISNLWMSRKTSKWLSL